MKKISVIIIAKNEEEKIEDCLKSVKWADDVVVVDNDSIDKTAQIAKKYGAKVVIASKKLNLKYSELRDLGLKNATGEWVLYVDADERVSEALTSEISNFQFPISNVYIYAIPRRNIVLGKELRHGGFYPDYVKRLYKKDKLKGWRGDLHEEPIIDGETGHLKNHLIHTKEDNLSDMVEKTNKWSAIEAKLIFDSGHPLMNWWRFIRIMVTEFWFRMIAKKAFLDGGEGIIFALYQVWSKFITYAKLWEMQLETDNLKLNSKNL